MAFDYEAEVVPVAIELIEEFGRLITFVELGDVAANPAKPWLGSASPRGAPKSTAQFFGVFVEPESMERLGMDSKTEDFLKRSDQIAIVRSDVLLTNFDEVIDSDGARWQIHKLSKLQAGPTLIIYFVHLRR